MSNPLEIRSRRPPGSRNPRAINTAEPAQMNSPSMVRMFGVRCSARRAGTTRRAPDLTQSWSLDVNTGYHRARAGTFACHAIHVENLDDDVFPVIELCLREPALAHRRSPRRVVKQGAERRRPFLGVARRNEHPVHVMEDHAAETRDRGCD